jgi:NADPH:quinone reductase-like Zn-dependent oxidoreductase
MNQIEFKAFVVEEKKGLISEVKSKLVSDLPEGDLLIKVHYSSLNYKDALSSIGNKGVTRKYPPTQELMPLEQLCQNK